MKNYLPSSNAIIIMILLAALAWVGYTMPFPNYGPVASAIIIPSSVIAFAVILFLVVTISIKYDEWRKNEKQ